MASKSNGSEIKLNMSEFKDEIKTRNPHEPEFLQAVGEVADSLESYLIEQESMEEVELLRRLCEPERIVIFRVPWIDDRGNMRVNRGYRVQMSSALGPFKGGTRFHPSVNLSILKMLAFEQIFKNSLTGLPLGAGKGGSDFDPKRKSDLEIMKFCQSFMTELSKYIGEDTDIPAGDIGVGAREIGYMFGQYKRMKNFASGVLTGKALEYGGILLRPEATGYGNVFFAKEMLEHHDQELKDKICIISGSGNVALHTAEKLLEFGAKVIALSDSSGTIHDPDGIDEEKLAYIKEIKLQENGRIKDFTDKYEAEYLEDQNPWNLKADLAFPSATQNELHKEDARQLIENDCLLVSEGANMPCTSEAVALFREAGILYGPGKAANAGGVAVSGLEMAQNASGIAWSKDKVEDELARIMKNIHKKCLKHGSIDSRIDYLVGANIAGFIPVASAMKAQGVV